jgi:UDP-N-acetylglucosamine 2-epimerase (non-hydrolysing)
MRNESYSYKRNQKLVGKVRPKVVPLVPFNFSFKESGVYKVISVVGARPNFIKIAPIHKAFQAYNEIIEHKICHTGQHFNEKMSTIFFDELEMPRPDFFLGISGGSHAEQTARIMIEFEKIVLRELPQMIIVPGDVNSTLACSLTASKLGVPIAHVEAGLRSFDRTMPEEINRLVTDSLSDLLFVSEESGLNHLKQEGIDKKKIFFTGNVMIDSLEYYLPRIKQSPILTTLKLEAGNYILVTFHRPANVDDPSYLKELIEFLNEISTYAPVVFPMHPRTSINLTENGLLDSFKNNIQLLDPVGYCDFLHLTMKAKLVITDSGGIQEETTYLGIPCITVRKSTERPVTVIKGTNVLAGTDLNKVRQAARGIIEGKIKRSEKPPLWDGKTAQRITRIIVNYLSENQRQE